MIIQKQYEDDPNLVLTYSDKGVYIHGGEPEADYEFAVDPADLNRTYIETDIPIPPKTDRDGREDEPEPAPEPEPEPAPEPEPEG